MNQRVIGTAALDGAGLWWVPTQHDGNRSASDEEVEVVVNLVEHLLGAAWVDENGINRPLVAADLRVVAPYNAQVNRLAARLEPLGVPVGTVDKFQGQTCAVVIYSMATSRPEDAPRGMEFLYSLNRLNVATSRARCAAFIVASPALIEPRCRTPGRCNSPTASVDSSSWHVCRRAVIMGRMSQWALNSNSIARFFNDRVGHATVAFGTHVADT